VYLLDTNTCIHFLNGTSEQVRNHFMRHSSQEIFLCSIVKAELLFRARKSQRIEQNLIRLKQFFAPLQSLVFDDVCAEEYAQIRADLAAQGKMIGANDLLIAAIAKSNNIVLVTNNTREFSRITNLRLVDWQEAA
jgi:tRNA(fMet)-specific endonuclease VapC